jgi:hypothetical protein
MLKVDESFSSLYAGWDYEQLEQFGSHAGQFGTGHGVQ